MKSVILWLILSISAICQSGGVPTIGFTGGAPPSGCGGLSGYGSSGTITINALGTLSGNLTNELGTFLGDSHLATVANGGLSQDPTAKGMDIIFCTAVDGTGTLIDNYLDPTSYVATTGKAEWLFKYPCINKSSTCKAYFFVGKNSSTDHSCVGNSNCTTTVFNNILLDYGFGWPAGCGSVSLIDRSGNAGTGTNHSAGCGSGIIGAALDGAYADSNFVLPSITNFSIMFFMLSDTNTPALWGFGGNVNSAGTAGIVAYSFASGGACSGPASQLCLGAGYASSAGSLCAFSNSYSLTGAPYHSAVVTHTGGSANLSLYFDGVFQTGTQSACLGGGSPTDPASDTNTFKLGRFGDFSSPFNMNAKVDNFRVAKIVYTADQALWYHTNTNNPASTYTVSVP